MNESDKFQNDKTPGKKIQPKPIKRVPRLNPKLNRPPERSKPLGTDEKPADRQAEGVSQESAYQEQESTVANEHANKPVRNINTQNAAGGGPITGLTPREERKPSSTSSQSGIRWIALGVIVLLVLVAGAFLVIRSNQPTEKPDAVTTNAEPDQAPAKKTEQLAVDEVASVLDTTISLNQDDTTDSSDEPETGSAVSEPDKDAPLNVRVASYKEKYQNWFTESSSNNATRDTSTTFSQFVAFVLEEEELDSTALFTAIEVGLDNIQSDSDEARLALSKLDQLFEVVKEKLDGTKEVAVYHYLLGQSKILSGTINQAIIELELAIKLVPNFEAALRTLYSMYALRGNTEKQLEVGTQLLAAAPRDVTVLRTLVEVLVADSRPQEALSLLEDNPNLVALHPALAIQKAQLMTQTGVDVVEIINQFDQTIEQHPHDIKARIFYLLLLDKAERVAQLEQVLSEIIAELDNDVYADDPGKNRYALVVASLSWKHGDEVTSERLYKRIIDEGGDLAAAAANDLAYKLAEKGERLEEAERLAKFAREEFPRQLSYIDTLAAVYLAMGDANKAVQTFEENTNVDTINHPLVIKTLIKAYEQAGLTERAEFFRNVEAAME